MHGILQRHNEIFSKNFSENLCNLLRNCRLEEVKGVRETLLQPSLIYQAHNLPKDVSDQDKIYPLHIAHFFSR